jgi:hypothetical protein
MPTVSKKLAVLSILLFFSLAILSIGLSRRIKQRPPAPGLSSSARSHAPGKSKQPVAARKTLKRALSAEAKLNVSHPVRSLTPAKNFARIQAENFLAAFSQVVFVLKIPARLLLLVLNL